MALNPHDREFLLSVLQTARGELSAGPLCERAAVALLDEVERIIEAQKEAADKTADKTQGWDASLA